MSSAGLAGIFYYYRDRAYRAGKRRSDKRGILLHTPPPLLCQMSQARVLIRIILGPKGLGSGHQPRRRRAQRPLNKTRSSVTMPRVA